MLLPDACPAKAAGEIAHLERGPETLFSGHST
jgi:hypothetical protein